MVILKIRNHVIRPLNWDFDDVTTGVFRSIAQWCVLNMLLNFILFCNCREEADEFVSIGALNGLFVLGRSIGFIGKRSRLDMFVYSGYPELGYQH